jgi:carboxylesterase type B
LARRWTDFMSQIIFICPLQTAMNALATNAPVFGYELNDLNTASFLPADARNVHGVDLFYLWGQDDGPASFVFFCPNDGPSCKLRKRMRQ